MTVTGPSIIDRRLHGDMADAIFDLRSDGRIVARYKNGFRVDSSPEIYSAAQIRGMAIELKRRRQAAAVGRKPDSPRRPMARHEIERNLPAVGNPPAIGESSARAENEAASGAALAAKLQGPMPNAGDGGETAATRGRPSPTVRLSPPVTWHAVGPGESLKSCGPCPVPPGGVVPVSTETASERRGEAEYSPAARRHTPASCGDALAPATGTSIREDGASPGPQDPIPAKCPCGRPTSHYGRCWHRRGMPGPVQPAARGKHPAGVCDVCQGPRSYWARSVCRKCYQANAAKAKESARPTRQANIAALWAEVAALKAADERTEKALSAIRAQLDMGGR